jgi:hypothetical protein
VLEHIEAELMQKRGHGDMRIACHGLLQREGSMRGQLADKSIRQRPHAVLLVLIVLDRRSAEGDDGALHRAVRRRRCARVVRFLAVAALFVLRRRMRGFVFLANEAAFDPQPAVLVEADEGAGPGDLGRVVDRGTILERFERCLDFAEPQIDLIGQFVCVCKILFEPVHF